MSESQLKDFSVVFGAKNTWGAALSDGVLSTETTVQLRTHLGVGVAVKFPKTKLN